MDDRVLKREIIGPTLWAASHQDGGVMIGVIANAPSVFELIVEVALEEVESAEKGSYRYVLSVLRIMRLHTNLEKRWPEIPEKFFVLLSKSLNHRTKTVREEALLTAVAIAAVCYMEFRTSGQNHQRKLLDHFSTIDPGFFQGEKFINFLADKWCYRARESGWKYQEKPSENIRIIEEIFGSIWPGFEI